MDESHMVLPVTDRSAVSQLLNDLEWQMSQLASRGIKNRSGQVYVPHYYKRGLKTAMDKGDQAVVNYVRRYVQSPPSDGYDKLVEADSLDLACEALVADASKPHAHLFTDADRDAARMRLAPYQQQLDDRAAERRKRIDAAREKLRREGLPRRSELTDSLRSRRL